MILTGNPTKEQEECIKYKAGDLLIKGVAGSGKSYVLLNRALSLYKENKGTASIRVFTYTNALVQYTDELLQDVLGEKLIDVSTVDSYFMRVYYTMARRPFNYNEHDTKTIIEEILNKHQDKTRTKHRFYSIDVDFWLEEFLWIQERCILTKEEYIRSGRQGRGSQIRFNNESEKDMVWSLYNAFLLRMRELRKNTWPELYLYINENIKRFPDKFRVDYVFIDEAQDMTLGKMRALKAMARKSITIAADMAQKIYKTSFTWKETGIDIQGRASKQLLRSFRSTKQIVTLAEDLMAANRRDLKLKTEMTEVVMPETDGLIPELFFCDSKVREENILVQLVAKLRQEKPEDTIGVIIKTKKRYYHIRELLKSSNVPYQEIFREGKYIPEWHLLEPGIKLVISKSSKGLEFDTVIIEGVEEGAYPCIPRNMDAEQLDEVLITERNTLYVAMTRAREYLYMLCTTKDKSRFIDEMQEEHYKGIQL